MDILQKQDEAKKKAQAQARLQKFRLKQQNQDYEGYKKKNEIGKAGSKEAKRRP